MGFSLKTTIGAIKSLYMNPCQVPATVYVETAVEAAMRLFWTYNEPDLKHLIHETQGHSWLCSMKTTFTEVREATNTMPSPATTAAFEIIELADQAAWWFFIASIANDTLIQWSSSIIKGSLCGLPPGSANGYGNEPVIGGVGDGTYVGAAVWRSAGWPTIPVGGGICSIGPGKFGSIGGTCNITNLSGVGIPSGLRIVNDDTGQVMNEVGWNVNGNRLVKGLSIRYQENNTDSVRHNYELQAMGIDESALHRYVGGGGSGWNISNF